MPNRAEWRLAQLIANEGDVGKSVAVGADGFELAEAGGGEFLSPRLRGPFRVAHDTPGFQPVEGFYTGTPLFVAAVGEVILSVITVPVTAWTADDEVHVAASVEDWAEGFKVSGVLVGFDLTASSGDVAATGGWAADDANVALAATTWIATAFNGGHSAGSCDIYVLTVPPPA